MSVKDAYHWGHALALEGEPFVVPENYTKEEKAAFSVGYRAGKKKKDVAIKPT